MAIAMATVEGRPAFSYGALAPHLAQEAREVADRVRARQRQLTAGIIETGHDLISIKEKMEHGMFLDWIKAEFGWAVRTAQQYMQAASTVGAKSATVAYLPPTALYALTAPSTPEPVRTEIFGRLESGEKVAPEEIKGRVREAREAERKEAQYAKMKPGKRYTAKRKDREEATRRDTQAESLKRRQDAATAAVEFLAARLGEDGLSEFWQLLERVDFYYLRDALKQRMPLAEAAE